MNKYLIFTDASADVDIALIKEENVGFVPMNFSFDDQTFSYSGINEQNEIKEFYTNLRKGKKPVTSQITPFLYEEFFAPYLEAGNSILYLSLSSGLSSTYSSACIAAKALNNKFDNAKLVVVDSLFATVALGLMVEKACELRANGKSIEDCKTALENHYKNIYCACFVEDIMHLKRGGRISGAKAAIGMLFGIKPIIAFNGNGKLDVADKKKGTRLAVSYLVNKYQELGNLDAGATVYVSDADNNNVAEFTVQKILAVSPNAKIKRVKLSPIIGTHLGPDSVIIGFEKI